MNQQESGLNASAVERQPRLDQLCGYFIDMAVGESLSPKTLSYVQSGGSLRLCLQEIANLADKSVYERQLDQERFDYVNTLLERPFIKGRPVYRQTCVGLRNTYIGGVVAKTERIVDAGGPEDALALLQMPTLVENASFKADRPLTMEDFSANHLYILIDTALQEHVARRNLISEHQRNTVMAKVIGNRTVRMAIEAGVFVATVVPALHVIPINSQSISHEVTIALEVLSAGAFGLEAPEEVRWRYLDIVHAKQTKAQREQLAESKRLADLALRAAYSSTRYGGTADVGTVTDRFGTDDKKDNLRRLSKLDEQFRHLNNDPGGKPYTGDQALGYAARLLIERQAQLAEIVALNAQPERQKELYLELVKNILTEDVVRMEKGLSSSRIRQRIVRIAGIIPAVLFPSALSLANDASSGGQDVIDAVTAGNKDGG